MLDYYLASFNSETPAFFTSLTPLNYKSILESKVDEYSHNYYIEHETSIGVSMSAWEGLIDDIKAVHPPYDFSLNSGVFQSFLTDFENTIYTYGQDPSFDSEMDALMVTYSSLLFNVYEKEAMIAGCQTAKASQDYWSTRFNDWETTFADPQNSPNNTGRMNSDDYIWADGVGAIGGIITGARIGVAMGGGGALAGVMIGALYGAAEGTARAYLEDKVRTWLGF